MIGNNGDKHKLDPKIIGSIGVAGTAVVTIVLSALLVGGLNDAADASYVKAYDDYQTELMVKQSIAKLNVDATVNNSNTSEKSETKPSLMQVGDDWYVAGNDSTVPSNNDSIIVDGTVYNKLDNTQKNDSSIEDAAEIPFYGTE